MGKTNKVWEGEEGRCTVCMWKGGGLFGGRGKGDMGESIIERLHDNGATIKRKQQQNLIKCKTNTQATFSFSQFHHHTVPKIIAVSA